MITIKTKGSWKNTFNFFGRMLDSEYIAVIERYAREGVSALSASTPIDSGDTAGSWDYKIEANRKGTSIYWVNNSRAGNTPVVILLQYGHATGTGGFVQGRDFINPAILPVFDKIADEVWREVTKN